MKALGAAAILAACLLYAAAVVRTKRRQLAQLRALCGALERMNAELTMSLMPLPALFSMCTGSGREEVDAFFRMVAIGLNDLESRSFQQIWEDALRQRLAELDTEEKRQLRTLGSWLGRYPPDEQSAALVRCLSCLRQSCDQRGQLLPQQSRLCFGLSAAAGVFLLILLL